MPLKPGQLVLAKVPSWSKWPAVVVPEDLIPADVMRARNKKDVCVFFFGNDPSYWWGDDKTITPLDLATCSQQSRKAKGVVKKAYAHALEYRGNFLGVLGISDDSKVDDEEEADDGGQQESEEDKKYAPTTTKRIQKGTKPSNSVKKDSPPAPSTPQDQTTELHSMSISPPSVKAVNGKTTWTDEEKYKQYWYIRTKLQKGLITRKEPATETDLKYCSDIMSKLEQLDSDNVTDLTALKNTKVHKVLKAILKVDKLERPQDFKFHERSVKLLGNWAPYIVTIKNEKLASPSVSITAESEIKKESNGISKSNGSSNHDS